MTWRSVYKPQKNKPIGELSLDSVFVCTPWITLYCGVAGAARTRLCLSHFYMPVRILLDVGILTQGLRVLYWPAPARDTLTEVIFMYPFPQNELYPFFLSYLYFYFTCGALLLFYFTFFHICQEQHNQAHFHKGCVPGAWDSVSTQGKWTGPLPPSFGPKPPSAAWVDDISGFPSTESLTGRPIKSGGSGGIWLCMSFLARVLDLSSNPVFLVRLASSCSIREPHVYYVYSTGKFEQGMCLKLAARLCTCGSDRNRDTFFYSSTICCKNSLTP